MSGNEPNEPEGMNLEWNVIAVPGKHIVIGRAGCNGNPGMGVAIIPNDDEVIAPYKLRNAHTMAASREMLAALKAIREERGTIDDPCNDGVCPVCGVYKHKAWCWYEQMMAAIAKAQWENPTC